MQHRALEHTRGLRHYRRAAVLLARAPPRARPCARPVRRRRRRVAVRARGRVGVGVVPEPCGPALRLFPLALVLALVLRLALSLALALALSHAVRALLLVRVPVAVRVHGAPQRAHPAKRLGRARARRARPAHAPLEPALLARGRAEPERGKDGRARARGGVRVRVLGGLGAVVAQVLDDLERLAQRVDALLERGAVEGEGWWGSVRGVRDGLGKVRTDRVREHFLGAPDEGEEEQKLDDVVELPSHVKAGPYQKARGRGGHAPCLCTLRDSGPPRLSRGACICAQRG